LEEGLKSKKAEVAIDAILDPEEKELDLLEYFVTKDRRIIDQKFDEYKASNRWMCDLSPTGAHHWVEVSSKVIQGISKKRFECKHCNKHRIIVRRYDAPFVKWGNQSIDIRTKRSLGLDINLTT